MESPPKQETNRREVADMTKGKVMKRSKDAKECWPSDRLMNGVKDEMMPKIFDSASSNGK